MEVTSWRLRGRMEWAEKAGRGEARSGARAATHQTRLGGRRVIDLVGVRRELASLTSLSAPRLVAYLEYYLYVARSRYQIRLSNIFFPPTRPLRQSTARDLLSKFPVSNAYRAHSAYHYFTNKRTGLDIIVDYKLCEARVKNRGLVSAYL